METHNHNSPEMESQSYYGVEMEMEAEAASSPFRPVVVLKRLKMGKKKYVFNDDIKRTVLQPGRVEDPFNPDVQGAFSAFASHVQKVQASDVDLSEASLLLAGATKIFTAQVDEVVKDVENLRIMCTRTKEAWNDKKKEFRKQREGADSQEVIAETTPGEGEETVAGEGAADAQPAEVEIKTEPVDYDSADTGSMDVLVLKEEIQENGNSGLEPAPEGSQASSLEGTNAETIQSEENTGNLDSKAQTTPGEQAESGEPPKKKARNGIIHPPTLISCIDELQRLQESGAFGDSEGEDVVMPHLEKAVRRSKRKIYDDGPDGMDRKEKEAKIARKKEKGHFFDEDGSPMELNLPKKSVSNFSLTQQFPSTAAASFPSEDQAEIQDCINDLHYLPFTFGLSKTDLASAFRKTVERLSGIFKKNNVQTDSVKESNPVIASSSTNDTLQIKPVNGLAHPHVAHNLGDMYSAYVKNCREECQSFISTASSSILERSKDKSFAESRANIRSMIGELQRIIVPKFARIPLMAENTPEFFQHVTNFEKKMKKILEEEAKKEEFDVRKYEREVLALTTKEGSEEERTEDFLVPNSPIRPQSVDSDNYYHLLMSPSTRSSFDGSHCGNGWVNLKHIFQHMKRFDRTETARSFYAILALLSYQNLDVNYDDLLSEDTAKMLDKQLKKRKLTLSEDMDTKFPRGVKIMKSRCPNADKEDVYVAALTLESRDEEFRHLLAKETRKIAIRDGAPSEAEASSEADGEDGEVDEGIAEAMADFVEETSDVFTGKLFGRRRNKKPIIEPMH